MEIKKSKINFKIFDIILILLIFLLIGMFCFFLFKGTGTFKGLEIAKKYSVTFDSNGGTQIKELNVKEGYIELPTDVVKEGYEFSGWYVEEKAVKNPYYVEKDVTLKAGWYIPKNKYNISLELNGGTGDDSVVSEFEVIFSLPKPKKEGYLFNGWYTKDDKLLTFPCKLDTNNVFYAKWYGEADEFVNVKFDSGSEVVDVKVKKDTIAVEPIQPYKDGYSFNGWYLDEKKYDFNLPITKDVTLIASWKKREETYNVIFNLNGGTGNFINQTIKYGETIDKPKEQPVRDGYTFLGWYYNNEEFNFNTAVKDNITLVAKWEKKNENNYSVTFDLNGGGSNYKKSVSAGGKITKPSNPTRSGYSFNGWYYNGNSYNFDTVVNKDITLVAKWTKIDTNKHYMVTFKANNGKTSTKTVVSGNKVEKPSNPTKSGYTFLGWYTDNKSQYDFNSSVTSDINLSALWAPKLNYKTNSSGKWIFINNPETLNSNDYLADEDYGNKLLFKTNFKGTMELFYSHKIASPLKNNTYYAIRVHNPNDEDVKLKINKCGVTMGWNTSEVWNQYYSGTCSLAGNTYTIRAHRNAVIFHNGDSFVYKTQNEQDDIKKITDAFEGVLNVTASNELLIATLVFKDIEETYYATYQGNFTESGNVSRVYSGTFDKLPVLSHDLTYEIYDQTPRGILPVSYTATDGKTYITNSNYEWRTNLVGGVIDTTSTPYKIVYKPSEYVGDFVKLIVPMSNYSFTLGPYKSYSETREVYNSNGSLMKGWPYKWDNWAVHYKENITIKNNSSFNKIVSFKLVRLTKKQTVNVLYNNKHKSYSSGGNQIIWTKTIKPGASVTVPTEILLGSRSDGGISRQLILE